MLSGLGLFGAALVVGCNGGGDTGEPVGSSEARIVLVAQGSSSANMHLTAVNDATAEVVIDQVINVDAGDSVVLEQTLDAASYTLHLDAFADESHTDVLASGDAHLDLQANLATEIFLAADTDGDASAQTGVSVSVHDVPTIDDVVVHHSTGSITIDVSAATAGGGELTYFWSGFGLEATVQGSASLTIPAIPAAVLGIDGETTIHLVVQNADGATVAVDIDLSASVNGEACVFCDAGTTSGADIIVDVSGDVDLLACLETRVSCNLACTAEAGAAPLDFAGALISCTADCGLQFADCTAGEN
ncbi:Hypothetical protein A7982_10791 [Minicystis rosea]|nr:Hypothetical protein A7982_10791 [Minicystis rosea]